MRVLVTGGAGFMGSYLVERLVEEGYNVVVFDNFSSGTIENLSKVLGEVEIVRGDLRLPGDVEKVFEKGVDVVFHFAASPEVRVGDPREHFENNIMATYNLLEVMRKYNVRDIVFASTSTVYGDATILPTPEDYGPLKPISLYGASKLSCEAMLSAYAHTFGFKAVVLRYANVVGPRSKRGVVRDFVWKLLQNPRELEILGDGTQRKSYIWIEDAIDATFYAWKRVQEGFEVYNVGSEDSITVVKVADIVVEAMGLRNVNYKFTGGVNGGRGWVGDVKYMHLDISKLKLLGWKPRYTSSEAVRKAALSILEEFKYQS